MKNIAVFLLIVVSVVVIGASPVFFVFFQSMQDWQETKEMSDSIDASVDRYTRGEIPYVDISKITDFSWDRLYIFGPLTDRRAISYTLGFDWGGRSLEHEDGTALLVFMYNGYVVRDVNMYIGDFNFGNCYRSLGYRRSEAHFIPVEVLGRSYVMRWVPTK